MPFVLSDWHVLSDGYGKSVWIYESSADNLAACAGSGYFNAVAPNLKNGDVILIQASDSSGWRRVSSATGAATVTVTTTG